jgi:mevalonate kinase
MRRKIKVSAPGKIILSGEHAVVYGKPEVLVAVNRRLTVTVEEAKTATFLSFSSREPTNLLEFAVRMILRNLGKQPQVGLNIRIESEIPPGCGMGSSAALAVAVTTVLFKYFDIPFNKKRVNQIAYEIEEKQHGNPSGGDNTVITYGGFLWYRKETEFLKIFKTLRFRTGGLAEFVLVNTGRPKETTGEMVSKVRDLYHRNKEKVEKILDEMEKVTKQMLIALYRLKNKQLMLTIKKNERLLEKLGVVSPFAQKVIERIEESGGAAKICGAGGRKKGAGIILSIHPKKEAVFEIAKEWNLPVFEVKLDKEGVRVEKD